MAVDPRGRTNKHAFMPEIHWTLPLYANKEKGKLVLFAEMKLPGEAYVQNNRQHLVSISYI
jgi:hypothetical protein